MCYSSPINQSLYCPKVAARRFVLPGCERRGRGSRQRQDEIICGADCRVITGPRSAAGKATRIGISSKGLLHVSRLRRIDSVHVASKDCRLEKVGKGV